MTTRVFPLLFAAPFNWYANQIQNGEWAIAEDEKFERQTHRNRIEYGTFQGIRTFSIPLVHSTLNGRYKEVKISYSQHWQKQLLNALQTSYGKSPFYEYYGYRFEKIIMEKHCYLWDLNMAIFMESLQCLKSEMTFEIKEPQLTSEIYNQPVPKYYQVFSEKSTFMPNLTILDLLFNEGPNSNDILIKSNQLLNER